MQTTNPNVPCPKCGSTDVKKINYTWWGGALGPAIFHQVRCNNCKNEYNGKTGQSNSTNILIYIVVSFVLAFCLCGGAMVVSYLLNNS